MKFWSDVEKEYNELLGDAPSGQDDDKDPDSSVGEFNDLLSDIKKDVKKIPKSEVFPSFTPDDKAEENAREDESEVEQESGRKTYSRKSKKNKKCTIGRKTYEIGDRWKDEKTGKDMMCILMNVPKNVQPLLADVDILTTKPSAENDTEWKRPSVEPQWSYTATPKRKECQEAPSGKPSEKPDKIESIYEEGEKSSKYQTESNEGQEKELDAPDVLIEEEPKEAPKESKELSKENKMENTEKEPKIIVVDPPEPEKEDAENNSEDDDRLENDNKPKPDETETKEKEAEKKASDEESGDSSDSEMEQENPKTTKPDGPKVKNNISSIQTETSTESSDKGPGVIESPEHSEKDSNKNDKGPNSDESNAQDNSKANSQDIPDSQENEAKEEKGEPIYTKETVVVQRKLIKTEKTIETTETEKNKK